MAHHKSAKKRIRQADKRKLHNRYYGKTTRNMVKTLRETTNKAEAQKQLPAVFSQVDRLAKRGIIHRNKAANLKSSLAKHVNSL